MFQIDKQNTFNMKNVFTDLYIYFGLREREREREGEREGGRIVIVNI